MTPFAQLPTLTQNLICFWALLACLFNISNGLLLWRQKRYFRCVISACCLLCAYFILQICREGTERRLHGYASETAESVLRWPYMFFTAALALLFLVCVLLFRNVMRWRRTHITADSIKESMDGLPAGVCYFLEDGRCILANHRMNAICLSLSGQPLYNGATFYDKAREQTVCALSDGTAVSFRHRILTYEGEPMHELIADDITELYNKSEQLRAGNERARRLSADMKAYGKTIADTVRRQETLQAKINIHDGMNRMILATQKAAEEDGTEPQRRQILRLWQNQALLLCKEADTRKSSNVVSDLNALASVIGIRLNWNGVPESDDPAVLSLFLLAAREAMANAAKHAKAEYLAIQAEESERELRIIFANDWNGSEPTFAETGGLAALRERIETAGGEMRIETGGAFRLIVSIPKGGSEKCHTEY